MGSYRYSIDLCSGKKIRIEVCKCGGNISAGKCLICKKEQKINCPICEHEKEKNKNN